MRYQNAETILPAELVEQIRQYVDGQTLYIPRKGESRKSWGSETTYRAELAARNRQILRERQSGRSVRELAACYYLSEKSIRRILRQEKDDEG